MSYGASALSGREQLSLQVLLADVRIALSEPLEQLARADAASVGHDTPLPPRAGADGRAKEPHSPFARQPSVSRVLAYSAQDQGSSAPLAPWQEEPCTVAPLLWRSQLALSPSQGPAVGRRLLLPLLSFAAVLRSWLQLRPLSVPPRGGQP